jgi:hypothetical protein
MSIRFFLGAYWRARRESIDRCADRLHQMFSGISTCDVSLATWYELGRSRKQALERRADVGSREYLVSVLDRGRHRRDTDKSVMDELGFGAGLWNGGRKGREAGLMLTCGCFTSNPNLGNCVALRLPEDLGDLRQGERMARLLASIATALEPDWAGVMSTDAMNARRFNARVPFVDWMIYLSKRLAPQIPPLPSPAVVRLVDSVGSIIVVQSEPPAPTSPEDLRNIERVETALRTLA